MRRAFTLLAIVGMLGASMSTGAADGIQSLLAVVDFHGDEIHAKSGEVWLGLFPDGSGFNLTKTIIHVARIHDPIVDESEKAWTGKRVSVAHDV